jgi:predicted permease
MQLPPWLHPELDVKVVLFAAAVALFTTFAAALGPARSAARVDTASMIAGSARSGESRRVVRMRTRLIIAQVGCSVMLLMSAAALYRSARSIGNADLGYADPQAVLLARATLPETTYPDPSRAASVLQEVVRAASILPSVRHASGYADERRLRGTGGVLLEVAGANTVHAEGGAFVSRVSVLPHYAAAMGLDVVRGMELGSLHTPGSSRVVMINESLGRLLGLGDDDVIGRVVRVPEMGAEAGTVTIVGVLEDGLEPQFGSAQAALVSRPTIFFPLLQHPSRDLIITLRADAEPMALVDGLRAAVQSVDPGQPLTQIMTLDRYLGFAAAPARWLAIIFAVVGAAAFGLASVGLYGVIAFLTRRRTREIGVRVAIGARKSDIVMLVAGQSSVPVVWGLAIGSLGAIALNQLLRGMLYDVGPADFVNLLVVGALVLGVVALATIRPALAATNVAATVALRDQT